MKQLVRTPLSVLDLAPIREGQTIADSFRSSLGLAQHVEKLGFRRFWMAEHHSLEGVASAATSVLLGYIAGRYDENSRGLGRRDVAQSRAPRDRRTIRHARIALSRTN